MSQAGIVDIEGSHPQIPTTFVADVGSAVPIANVLEILGTTVAAHSIPLHTTGSGNTITVEAQYASASASSIASNAGFASFDSATFTVDANGFVQISSTMATAFTVDASTPPGTNPVVPNGSGFIAVTGGQVAAGTTNNVIRTDSLAANTYTIEVQRSQAVSSSTIGDNGVSHFNSADFTVDSNGFVSAVPINGIRVFLTNQINNVTGDGTYYSILYDTIDYNSGAFTYNALTGEITTNSPGLFLITANVVAVGMNSSHHQGFGGFIVNSHGGFFTINNPYATSGDGFYLIASGTMTGYTVSTVIQLTNGDAGESIQGILNVANDTKTVGVTGKGGVPVFSYTNSLSVTKLS